MLLLLFFVGVGFVGLVGCSDGGGGQQHGISRHQLDNWSSQFGGPLFEFARSATKYNELLQRYQQSRETTVEQIKLDQLINEIQLELSSYLEDKVGVLMKSTSYAEQRANDYYTFPPSSSSTSPNLNYVNAKRSRDYYTKGVDKNWPYPVHLETSSEKRFGEVNTSTSTVHVPTGVNEMDPLLLREIDWSSDLDTNYIANLRDHPTIYWQYFCSAAGFMRQYPGHPWPPSPTPDMYDCRTRPPYLLSSTSPKSILILLDNSGSMTGANRAISYEVVVNILNTLTEYDSVGILVFNDLVKHASDCLSGLVPATVENLKHLKDSIAGLKPSNVGNYQDAIVKGLELLQGGPPCNRALLLVSDGPPYDYQDLFNKYQLPHSPVRVFTYLIGKTTDTRNMKRIACTNSGYYVHIETEGAAHEESLKYLKVLSRPLVMNGSHFISWSGVYGDLLDTRVESEWGWKLHEGRQQKKLLQNNDNEVNEQKENPYNYVISASVPIYDVRNATNGERLANFLGVVATDISIIELKRLMTPFKLGVNGYGFMVNTDGRVLFHPEWRPVEPTSGVLKPNYNSVDLTEVEILDSTSWRNNDSLLLEMREEILSEEHSYRPEMRVKVPVGGYKHVSLRSHRYEYTRLKSTPYTLILVSPTNINRFNGRLDPLRLLHDTSLDLIKILEGSDRKFKLNPEWVYCEYLNRVLGSKEEELIHFLRRMKAARGSWKWRNTGEGIKTRHGHHGNGNSNGGGDEEVYRCDRDLVTSLLFDANATEVFTSGKPVKYNKHESEIITMHGALLAFLSTRSGLTRWIQLSTNSPIVEPPSYLATDSPYYKRAVDRYFLDPNSFVFNYEPDTKTVVGSRALFARKSGRSAPVLVVGIQFTHSKWMSRFFDITESCIESQNQLGSVKCSHTCSSELYDCYVLDDGGFIMISESDSEIGKSYSDVNGMVMEMLVNSDVYKRVRVVDYQGVCRGEGAEGGGGISRGNLLISLFSHLWAFIQLVLANLLFNHSYTNLGSFANNLEDTPHLNKSNLTPCDITHDLYTYGPSYNTHNFSYHGLLTKCSYNCDGYFNVHHIPRTNLVLVVTDGRCKCQQQQQSQGGANSTASGCPADNYGGGRSGVCIDSNPEEKAMREDCGGASVNYESRSLLLLLIVTLVIIV